MRDAEGNKLMPIWKWQPSTLCIIVAAWTRKEAIDLIKDNKKLTHVNIASNIKRIKNCFASFKEGKILT